MINRMPVHHRTSLDVLLDNDFGGQCDFCGRCCTAVSVRSLLPDGSLFDKPSGVKCRHLGADNRCQVWGEMDRQPLVCRSISPTNSLCRFDLRGTSDEAKKHYSYLRSLERATRGGPRQEQPVRNLIEFASGIVG